MLSSKPQLEVNQGYWLEVNQGYWLLMINIELSDRLKLIKHQMEIIQAKDDNDEVDQTLRNEIYSNQRTKIPSSSIK